MIKEHIFKDHESLINALHSEVVDCLQNTLANKGSATVLLSGGSTPAPLYKRLSQTDLHWDKVNIALVDERWVDPEHEASNERFLRGSLLTERAASAQFMSMKNQHETAELGAAQCNEQYAHLAQPYTLCLLGMGADGHTASLFPNSKGLVEALNISQYCTAINAIPSETTGNYTQRMTMTPWSILKSKKIVLLFTGQEKWAVYKQAINNISPQDLPLSIFLQQDQRDIDVYWAP